MANYTIDYVNGEYVRVDKPARRVVQLEAACVRGSNWRVWSKPRQGGVRPSELRDSGARIGVAR